LKRDNNGGEENERRNVEEEREGCWKFQEKEREDLAFKKNGFSFLFSFSFQKQFHMSFFNWSKKGPPLPLI